jgi:hypothetical protein
MPFAVPPARIEMGPGTVLHERNQPIDAAGPRNTTVLRGGLHPTQLLDAPAARLFDVGLGYRSEWQLELPEQTIHGPYAELGVYPLRLSVAPRTRVRWGGYASADAVLMRDRDPGLGATFGSLLEVTGEVRNGRFAKIDSDSTVVGAAQGQWAVGWFASTTLRELDDDFSQSLVTGLSVRLPFVVGLACCAWPRLGKRDRQVERAAKVSAEKPPRTRPRRVYRPARPRREP